MAMKETRKKNVDAGEEVTSGRRVAIGINVTVSVLLALALVVLVNVGASAKRVRTSMAMLGGDSMSARTRQILEDVQGKIQITSVFLSNESGKQRERYLDRLVTYCDELVLARPDVEVTHISNEEGKAEVVGRIKKHFAEEAKGHEQIISEFNALVSGELNQSLSLGGVGIEGVSSATGWLSGFPIYTDIVSTLADDKKSLENAQIEVSEMMRNALPDNAAAVQRISQAIQPTLDRLRQIQEAMAQIAELATAVEQQDSPMLRSMTTTASALSEIIKPLRASVSAENPEPPADAAAALKSFADAMFQVDSQLNNELTRIKLLTQEHPALMWHRFWMRSADTGARIGNVAVSRQVNPGDLLSSMAAQLRQNRQIILDIVDRNDPELAQRNLETVRDRFLPQIEKTIADTQDILIETATALQGIDDASRAILKEARGRAAFATAIDSLMKMVERIAALPELKLGPIAEQLRQDNIVVIEAEGNIKVVSFDEVWPRRPRISSGADDQDMARYFDGDAAISRAILSETAEKPFATVVLTSFEVMPPPQMRQFQEAQMSSIPMQGLNEIKRRLTEANFEVKEWNLADESAGAGPPEAAEGTQRVFVCMPPAAPPPPNPFRQQQGPPRQFGPAELERIKSALGTGGRAIFLATWEVQASFPMGYGSVPYAYRDFLRDSYGIDVDTSRRVFGVIPDARTPGSFRISFEKAMYSDLNDFTDHPIGRPLRYSKVVTLSDCVLKKAETVPEGVTVETVLGLPSTEDYLVVTPEQFPEIVDQFRENNSGGLLSREGFDSPQDCSIIMAAEHAGGETKSRVVVFGSGQSFMDQFITQPIPRSDGQSNYTDPPPTNNADLLVNSLHWVCGQESWIATGQAVTPVIASISPSTQQLLRFGFGIIVPLLVAGIPGLLMYLNRRQ